MKVLELRRFELARQLSFLSKVFNAHVFVIRPTQIDPTLHPTSHFCDFKLKILTSFKQRGFVDFPITNTVLFTRNSFGSYTMPLLPFV